MKLPNVVGGGAAKCGTTSLYNYLLGHPEVFLPRERKEIAFFSPSVASGLETFDDYKALYAAAMPQRHKAVLDISTSYLYDAQAPELIRRHLGPEVKIIVFLRNPAHMAFSLWLHTKSG